MKKSNLFKSIFEFMLVLLIIYILEIVFFELQPSIKIFIGLIIIVSVNIYFKNYYLIEEDNDYSNVTNMILFYSIMYSIVLLLATSVFRGQNINITNSRLNVINLIPIVNLLKDIKIIVLSKNLWLLNHIICNIVMFVPFTYLLPRVNKGIGFKKTTISIFLLSLTIECFQYIFGTGVFDIDDIILNTLGSIAFYPLLNKSWISTSIDKFILFKTNKFSVKYYLTIGVIMFLGFLLLKFLISSYWNIGY